MKLPIPVIAFVVLQCAFTAPTLAGLLSYRFADSPVPAFQYFSGDLPCDITASLSGSFSVLLNEESSVATLKFDDVLVSSVETTLFGQPYNYPLGGSCSQYANSLDGKLLSSILPGGQDEISGHQTNPGEFQFGPALTSDQLDLREIKIQADNDVLRIVGTIGFHGFDGGSYRIESPIVAVSEPIGLHLMAVFVAAIATRKVCHKQLIQINRCYRAGQLPILKDRRHI